MKLYALMATGIEWLSETGQSYPSKRLFTTPEEAIADRDDFVRRCTEPTHDNADCLQPSSIDIYVVEYDFNADLTPGGGASRE